MVKPLHLILCLNLNRLKRMNCHRCHHRHQNWPETLNSKLLLVTSSTCFGHVGLNSCHEGIDSPLCCNITKINVNHGSWIDHNWHISRVCTQLNKHTHTQSHTYTHKHKTYTLNAVCLLGFVEVLGFEAFISTPPNFKGWWGDKLLWNSPYNSHSPKPTAPPSQLGFLDRHGKRSPGEIIRNSGCKKRCNVAMDLDYIKWWTTGSSIAVTRSERKQTSFHFFCLLRYIWKHHDIPDIFLVISKGYK